MATKPNLCSRLNLVRTTLRIAIGDCWRCLLLRIFLTRFGLLRHEHCNYTTANFAGDMEGDKLRPPIPRGVARSFAGFYAGGRRDTLRIRLDRQCPTGWLCRTHLEDRQPCYALGRRGQQWFGVRGRKGFPFGKDGLLQHIGIATFCALAGFRRLLPEEFFSTFKECKEPKLPSHSYCLDESNPESLAWIVVDHASTARRFYDKVSKIVADRLPYDGFRKLFEATASRLSY